MLVENPVRATALVVDLVVEPRFFLSTAEPRADLPAGRIRGYSLRPLRLPRGIRAVGGDVHQ